MKASNKTIRSITRIMLNLPNPPQKRKRIVPDTQLIEKSLSKTKMLSINTNILMKMIQITSIILMLTLTCKQSRKLQRDKVLKQVNY